MPERTVIVSAACDLVAACGDLTDELRILLADPAEDEECRLRSEFVKKIECLESVLLITGFKVLPIPPLYERLKGADMKIILDEHRQKVPRPLNVVVGVVHSDAVRADTASLFFEKCASMAAAIFVDAVPSPNGLGIFFTESIHAGSA